MEKYQKRSIIISLLSPFLSYFCLFVISIIILRLSNGKFVLSDTYNTTLILGGIIAINFGTFFYLIIQLNSEKNKTENADKLER